MIKKILSILFGLIIVAGFFVLLGTAGASDVHSIALKTILKQGAIGLGLMCFGFVGLKVIDPLF